MGVKINKVVFITFLLILSSMFVSGFWFPESPPPVVYSANSTRWAILGPYLYDNGGFLDFDESVLNATIDARFVSTDFFWDLDEKWIYNNSNTATFNETLLNATIDARQVMLSRWTVVGPFLYNDTDSVYFNETLLTQTINSLENDTLAELSCNDDEIAKWNNGASQWECADDDFEADTDT